MIGRRDVRRFLKYLYSEGRENLTLIDGDYKAASIRIHKKPDNPAKDKQKES
jgi:hypothetical protein